MGIYYKQILFKYDHAHEMVEEKLIKYWEKNITPNIIINYSQRNCQLQLRQ